MYLYSRAVRITGQDQEMMRLAGEITRIINTTSGLDMVLWRQLFGTTPGVVAWTAMVESRAAMMEDVAKFQELPELIGLVDEFRQHATTPVDSFRWLMDYEDDGAGPPAVAMMNAAQAIGPLDQCFEWAAEMASFAAEKIGRPVVVAANTVGPMGQISWHSGGDSLADMDAAEMALWSDPTYMQRINTARQKGLFAPGRGGQWLYGRVD